VGFVAILLLLLLFVLLLVPAERGLSLLAFISWNTHCGILATLPCRNQQGSSENDPVDSSACASCCWLWELRYWIWRVAFLLGMVAEKATTILFNIIYATNLLLE